MSYCLDLEHASWALSEQQNFQAAGLPRNSCITLDLETRARALRDVALFVSFSFLTGIR